jgi:hypothetical protein
VAEIERRMGNPEAGTAAFRAVETASNAQRIARAVGILVQTGDEAGARRLVADFDDLPMVPATIGARYRARGELSLGAGRAKEAVADFERGFAGARRGESRVPLARALARAGEWAQAERVLSETVARPVAMYSGPEPGLPAPWRQAVLELATAVKARNPSAARDLANRFTQMLPVPAGPRTP